MSLLKLTKCLVLKIFLTVLPVANKDLAFFQLMGLFKMDMELRGKIREVPSSQKEQQDFQIRAALVKM